MFQLLLPRLYKSTGRVIAATTLLSLALHKMLKLLVKVFKSLYFLSPRMDLIDTGLKFYAVPSRPTSMTLRSRSQTLKS